MTRSAEPATLLRKRRAAQAVLWFEQLWPAVWPGLGVLGAYACLGLLDVPSFLPAWPRMALLAVVLVVAAGLLWRGLSRVERPGPATADRRLERETGLKHRPLATLSDQPAAATPEQEILWREHVARLTAQIGRLRIGPPRPGLARRDVWALRGGLLVALAASVAVAGPDAPARLLRAFAPGLPASAAGPGTQVQAWVTPPAYTGLPPLVLKPETSEARVPEGSHVTVSVTGGGGAPTLDLDQESEAFKALDAKSWQAERDLGAASGHKRLSVQRHGQLAEWTLVIVPDQAPVPAFTEPPGPNVVGRKPTLQSRFAWQAVDDYGVTQVMVELRLRDRPEAPAVTLPAAVTGAPKSPKGALVTDLTPHPWAGLPVMARLVAKDAPGHVGTSEDEEFVLPARAFENPVARALIAVRRQLSVTPRERMAARAVLGAIAEQPDAFDNNTGILLNLRAVASLLQRGQESDTVDEAQSRLWQMALALEEGAVERTAQALEQARQSMRDLLDPNRPEKPEQAEIERRMQELREAIQRHLEALAEQAQRDGTEMPADPDLPQMTARDLDRMAEQMQQALKEGRTEDAKREMAELERMLEALKNARPENGQAREQQRAERRQRGREQQDAVQDMIQREGQLLDRSESRSSPRTEPQSGDPRSGDAKSQQAMRRALGELMQQFGDLTGKVPAPLGEADQAMRDAAQALRDGKDAAAGDAARRAIEALQKGGQQMGQQVARQFGTGQQEGQGEGQDGDDGMQSGGTENRDGMTNGTQPGERSHGSSRSTRRDPLGRPLDDGTSGSQEAGRTVVPDEMEQARTRAIQEELRRRGADRTRPQPELDYIDRLLKPF